MATSIHPSVPVLSPSFLYHPYIPSFQSKDFSFTCYNSMHICNRGHAGIVLYTCTCMFIHVHVRVPAGLVAGISMATIRSSSLSLYAATKALEVLLLNAYTCTCMRMLYV